MSSINKKVYTYLLLENHICIINSFQCATGQCVNLNARCDANDDCPEGTDEIDCGKNIFLLKI